MSQTQEELFTLMAHAQDLQKHAAALQQVAGDALKKLPEGVKSAVNDSSRELITQAAEKASRGIFDASQGALAATVELRGTLRNTWLIYATTLVVFACVVVAGLYFGTGWMITKRTEELKAIQDQISAEEARKAGFELVEWGIVLPKGREIERTGRTNDGRAAVIFK
jgi:hypothetical protein